MKKRVSEFLAELGYGDLADLDMFTGNEIVEDSPIYKNSTDDLTVWTWHTDGATGFIRDDASGMRAIADTTRDGQLALAAWNCDFDIRLLAEYIDDDDLETALENAKENEWGFRDGKNIWNEA